MSAHKYVAQEKRVWFGQDVLKKRCTYILSNLAYADLFST